jgi:glutathione S-transferase
MDRLIGLPYSPWTEKARWALDHHRVPYRFREYLPIFGIPLLRIRTGRYRGRLSVPVYLGENGVLTDSFDIAQFAESHGGGAPLFPAGHEAEVAEWNRESDTALAAGRALSSVRIAGDAKAKEDSVPSMFPRALRPALRPLVDVGIRYLKVKYGFGTQPTEEHEAALGGVLDRMAEKLGNNDYLLGKFSYADICMAMVLQFVSPVANEFIPLGDAARPLWGTPALAARHHRLLEWRDRLFQRHRRAGDLARHD